MRKAYTLMMILGQLCFLNVSVGEINHMPSNDPWEKSHRLGCSSEGVTFQATETKSFVMELLVLLLILTAALGGSTCYFPNFIKESDTTEDTHTHTHSQKTQRV